MNVRHLVSAAIGLLAVLVLCWTALADAVLTRPLVPPPGDAGHFATVNGVRAYYRVEGRGPPLILLHGLGSSHLTWRSVTSPLANYFTVYAVDMPGFGYSDKPAGFASARQEAHFIDSFLGIIGIAQATVIGHSMGGDVALWLAIEHPRRVERLVIVNAAEFADAASVFQVAATPIVGDVMLKSTTTPLTMRLLMSDPYRQKQVLTPDIANAYAQFYWAPGARQALIDHARSYEADRASLRSALSALDVPTLIVWTDHDPYFSTAVAAQLRGLLPSAALTVIPAAGHLPQEEQPGAFVERVLQWFDA